MQAYIIRRLLLTIPTLWIVTLIVFFVLRFIPGDAVDIIVSQNLGGTRSGKEDIKTALRRQLGLDLPVHQQYLKWMAGLLRGDFGASLWSRQPVTDLIAIGLPVSLEVGGLALIISLLIALPVAIYSGMRPDSKTDLGFRSLSIFFICVPDFWVGTVVLIFPPLLWGWGTRMTWVDFADKPVEHLIMVIVPAFILGMLLSGITMRFARNMMLEVLSQDYIRTAWSKGLRERWVVIRHVLKNAFIPVITMIGLLLPVMLGAAVVVETIFSLPGLGNMLVRSIEHRDYPVISGVNMVVATFVLFLNIVIDISYAWFDPRIRYT
jgi:peptide/nickel transport system permease protein